MNLGNVQHVRPGQDTQRDVDHLQILGSRRAGHLSRSGSDVVDDGVLEPGHTEVQPLGVHLVLDAADSAEDDGAMTALN